MTEDKIEHRVVVSDNAQTGDITLIGKMVYVIKNPAGWQSAIWDFLLRHRYFVSIAVALEFGLTLLFLRLKNMYLIPVGLWAIATILLFTTAWGWYTWGLSRRATPRLLVSVVGTVMLGVLIIGQGARVSYPNRFAPEVFGIALAELGEGPNYSMTTTSRQISDQVYEFLLQVIQRENQRDTIREGSNYGIPRTRIEVRRIGVIPNSETARSYGERIGAAIVIWGQVVASEENAVTIRFQVLQTVSKADDPDFAFVLPIATDFTDVSVTEFDLEPNPSAVKRAVAEQSSLMSSYILGLIYYLDQNFTSAVSELTSATQTIQNNPTLQSTAEGRSLLYYYLGTALHRLTRVQEGQDFLLQAQVLNREEPAIPLSLAFGYRNLGMQREFDANLSLAFDLLNKRLGSHPHDTTAMYDRGIAHYLADETELDIIDYQQAIEIDPSFFVAYINLGRAYTTLERYAEAEKVLVKSIQLAEERSSNSGMAWLELARTREAAGNADSARQAYIEATKRLPSVSWTHYYYARFLETQWEFDSAMFAYERSAETSTNKAWAYREAGDFARRTGLLRKALDYYGKALHEDPKASLVRTYLAETYYELGEWETARTHFKKAIASAGDSYYPYTSYAWRLQRQGLFEEAVDLYEQSLLLHPSSEFEMIMLARGYLELGNCERALQIYSEILALDADFSDETLQEARSNVESLSHKCDE